MTQWWRRTGYNRAMSGTGNDTDALQTDVMRFMSILGLCLMAVFALVQSLPLQQEAPVPSDHERVQLHEEITTQQQHVQVLKAELQRLIILVEQAKAERMEAELALGEAEQQLTQVVDQTGQARSEQQRLTSELKRLQQRLDRERYTLTALRQATDDKAESLHTLQQRLQLATSNLDNIQQMAGDLKRQQVAEERRHAMHVEQRKLEAEIDKQETIRQQARTVRLLQADLTPVPVIDNQASSQKGFTLRFASAEALEHQVATGSVNLYAMADTQAWRLRLPHGRPVFTNAAFPGWFHEMAATTVPDEYVRQLEIAVAPKANGAVVWGVQLPSSTKRDIAALIRGRQGGDLVIAANGRVKLAAE